MLCAIILINLFLFPVYILGIFFSLVLSILPLFPTKTAFQNFQIRYKSTFFLSWLHVVRLYLNYFYTCIEYLIFLPLRCASASNFKNYSEFLKNNYAPEGMIFMSAHMGNIETAAWLTAKSLNQFHRKVVCLAKPSKRKWITNFIIRYRSFLNIEILLNNKLNLFREMVKTLKDGHGLALILDQKPLKGGLFLPFFGEEAAFPYHGLQHLFKCDAAVSYVCVRRLMPGYFYIEYQIGRSVNCNTHTTPNDLFKNYVIWLEAVIQKAPHQWCWDYKKWSRKPMP